MKPLLSVITTTLNAKNELLDTIQCVNKMKKFFKGLNNSVEYIVIDGMSSDGTVEVIKEYHKMGVVDKFLSEKDNGIYDAMNKGLKLAEGSYILILGAGDVFLPSKVQEIVNILVDQSPDILYGAQLVIRKFDMRLERVFFPGSFKRIKINFGWHPPHASTIVKRELLVGINGFDEKYSIAADIKAHWLLFKQAKKVVYLNDILSVFPVGGTSNRTFKSIVKANFQSYLIAKELGLRLPIIAVLGKVFWKFFLKVNTKICMRNKFNIHQILKNIDL